MKIEVSELALSAITYEIDRIWYMMDILDDFVKECDDKRKMEYSSLISIISSQLGSISSEIESILAKAKENTTGSN